jgi:molybdopterin-guanine dinucleotide biosynthesis protein A
MIADATGVVLAGGLSTRFGADKALARWDGGTLLESICLSLLGVLPRVIVVAKADRPRRVAGPRVSFVPDLRALRHPLSGLEAGLAACATPWAFVTACDMPFAGPELIRRLAGRRAGAQAVAARRDGRAQPFGAFYAREVLAPLTTHLDAGGSAAAFLDRLATRWVLEAPAGSERDFFDLDDQAAYREALSAAKIERAVPRGRLMGSRGG